MSSTTIRLRLPYPDGADGPAGPDVPHWMRALAVALDDSVIYDQGFLSARPSSGVEGRMYYAIDDGCLYYDTGRDGWVPSAWQPGDIRWSAAPEAPPVGWLTANGRALDGAMYPGLFRKIGTTFGEGDRSTTKAFNLPDLRARFPLGATPAELDRTVPSLASGLTNKALATSGGVERHLLAIGELPRHDHGASTGRAGSHSHSGTTDFTDISHSHPSQDGRPFLTDHQSTRTGVYAITTDPNRPYVGNGGGGYTGAWNPRHQHSFSTSTQPEHTHTVTVTSAGDGQKHENMPPYVVLNAWIKT